MATDTEQEPWGEGTLRARPVGDKADEIPKVEIPDREEPYEQSLGAYAPGAWSKLLKDNQARLHRVFRSIPQPEEQSWRYDFDWRLRLIPISETVADGRLQPGEYMDGWEFALLGDDTELRIYDLDRGEPSDDTLLTHPDRTFAEELLMRWPEEVKRVKVELTEQGEVWTGTVHLPDELDPDFPKTAFVILKNPKEDGEEKGGGKEAGEEQGAGDGGATDEVAGGAGTGDQAAGDAPDADAT